MFEFCTANMKFYLRYIKTRRLSTHQCTKIKNVHKTLYKDKKYTDLFSVCKYSIKISFTIVTSKKYAGA